MAARALAFLSLIAAVPLAACGASDPAPDSEPEAMESSESGLTASECQQRLAPHWGRCISDFWDQYCTGWRSNIVNRCVSSDSPRRCQPHYDNAVTACQAGNVVLHRYFLDRLGVHRESPTGLPGGWLEARWSLRAAAGTGPQNNVPLYRAIVGKDDFLTNASNYEAQTAVGLVGFSRVSTGQAIYRCVAGADHFVSSDPGCEGTRREGLLGYGNRL